MVQACPAWWLVLNCTKQAILSGAAYPFLYMLRVRAVEALQRRQQEGQRDRYWKIAGGTDLLPCAFARQLSRQINYGSPVVRIEHTRNSVRVVARRPGGPEMFTADRLICAIPFTLLRRVEIAPDLSFGKRRAIAVFVLHESVCADTYAVLAA